MGKYKWEKIVLLVFVYVCHSFNYTANVQRGIEIYRPQMPFNYIHIFKKTVRSYLSFNK